MGELFAGGKRVEVGFPILHTHKLHVSRMRKRTDLIVEHWTGGENPVDTFVGTLKTRGLSCHFFVDHEGSVYQLCDADALAAHARGHNARSVGVEIQNHATGDPVVRGIRREVVLEDVHGVPERRATFTPAQVAATIKLTEALCAHYGLPFAVPMDGRDVVRTTLPVHELAEYRGVVGHYHLTRRKRDPGLALMRAIAATRTRGRDGAAE
jgi:N-acetyl-anhydromuramyl-L-alanine amidase AmpD